MQCENIKQVIEQEGLEPLPEAARIHVVGCRHCRQFIADLEAIVSVAHEFPAEVEPPARAWISLRNQLESEGVIWSETVPVQQRSSWRHSVGHLFRGRALAALTAGALIAAAAMVQIRHSRGNQAGSGDEPLRFIEQTRKVVNDQEAYLQNMHLVGSSSVDASLQQNLQQLDDFIADCERHLKEAPQDQVAREYLYNAYQQKAELLSAMLDRGRSVN